MESRIGQLRERADNAKEELESNEVTVTSKDRAVTVTVNGSGSLLGLEFSARAQGMSPQQLAAKTMQAYHEACSQAAERTAAIMSGLLGEDSEAMDVLRSAMPPPPPESDEDTDDDGWNKRSPW